MDAAAFASQLREALDYLAQGISADPRDIDDITGARVISYADAGYLTGDAGFEITASDGSQLQVTVLQRALARPQGPQRAARPPLAGRQIRLLTCVARRAAAPSWPRGPDDELPVGPRSPRSPKARGTGQGALDELPLLPAPSARSGSWPTRFCELSGGTISWHATYDCARSLFPEPLAGALGRPAEFNVQRCDLSYHLQPGIGIFAASSRVPGRSSSLVEAMASPSRIATL